MLMGRFCFLHWVFFKELSRSQEAADLIKLEHSVIRVRSFPPRSRPRPTLHRRVDSRIWVAATILPNLRSIVYL